MPPDASTSTVDAAVATWVHRIPPSWVDHSSGPKTQPSEALANRTLPIAALRPASAAGTVATNAQCAPPSAVVTSVVQLPASQGTTPSANPLLVETNVTEVGWNPAGTGPPAAEIVGVVPAVVAPVVVPVDVVPVGVVPVGEPSDGSDDVEAAAPGDDRPDDAGVPGMDDEVSLVG